MPVTDKRSALLDKLADHVLAEGLAASSLRALAKAAGTSDRMLLYYFKDKSEIVGAILEVIAQRQMGLLAAEMTPDPLPLDALRQRLWDSLSGEAMWPFMCVWLEVASLSARGDVFYRTVGEVIGRGFLDWGKSQLDSPNDAARDRDAARLLTSIEGMLVLKSFGLADISQQALD